jgi:inosine-uridine nucleoside N-ribohydrolase
LRRLILDTDPGVDDAFALLYLHRRPDVELAGITTVAGNGTIDDVTRNALFLAERFGIAAPVARGAAVPLERALRAPPAEIHGANALGDVPILPLPSRAEDPRPAHRLIIDLVRERPGEMTLLAVGMFTNLARAIIDDPGIVPLVREVVVMGGAFGTAGHYGNAWPVAEANVFSDPHAADIVCTAAWPLTIVGLDATERILMDESYLARLRDGGTDEGAFLWDVSRAYQAFHAKRDGIHGIYAHDSAAAVCALDDSAFVFRRGPVRVVGDGIAVGMTLQKPEGRPYGPSPWDDAPAQRVAIDVDAERVLDAFAAPFLDLIPSP